MERYQHIVKLSDPEVQGLLDKPCHVFPKLDGTNGSIWSEDGELHFASRNREVSLDNDNQGFMNALHDNENIRAYFKSFPNSRLYGEWLVPHSLKDYQDDAWRKFYVFDVMRDEEYLPYDAYKMVLDFFNIDYIPCTVILERGTDEQIQTIANNNTFLMKDGKIGEGIVIKRYDFVNKYGRITWGKYVRNEFKTLHWKEMGPMEYKAKKEIEREIAYAFVTQAMVDKVHANLGEWSSKKIPQLLNTVFYDLIREESWEFLKKHKFPDINYKTLQKYTFEVTKELKKELF